MSVLYLLNNLSTIEGECLTGNKDLLRLSLSTEHGSRDQSTQIFLSPGQTAALEEQLGQIPSQGPRLFGFIHELTMSCFALQRRVFPRDTFVNVEALHMYALASLSYPSNKTPHPLHGL